MKVSTKEVHMHCSDVHMKLRDLPLSTAVQDKTHIDTLNHYATCAHCRPLGIGAIKHVQISCQEAIAICLRGECLLFDADCCETLVELAAHEHVFGAQVANADGRITSPKHAGIIGNECTHAVCSFVRSIWENAPLCSHYDGDDEKAHGAEWTIDKALREGWHIEPLLQALRDRRLVLEDKARGAEKGSARQMRTEMASIDLTLASYD